MAAQPLQRFAYLCFLLLAIVVSAETVCAQSLLEVASLRSEALAASTVAIRKSSAQERNPAALSLDTAQLLTAYASMSPFKAGDPDQNELAGGVAYQLGAGGITLSAGIQRSMLSTIYSDQLLMASLVKRMTLDETRELTLGARVRQQQVSFGPRYEAISGVLLDAGVLFDLTTTIALGASATNVLGADFERAPSVRESFPRSFDVGISYLPLEEACVLVSVERDAMSAFRAHAGIEYRLEHLLALRVGTATNPSVISYGVALHYSSFELEASAVQYSMLGTSLSFGLGWHW